MDAFSRLVVALDAVALVVDAAHSEGAEPTRVVDARKAEVLHRPDAPVTSTDQRQVPVHASPVLAADPGNSRVVVAAYRRDTPEPGCELHVSHDGGSGWLPAPPLPLPEGAHRCYAPQVAFGPDRALHVVFLALSGPGHVPVGVYLATSTDRARSFSMPKSVAGPGAVMVTMAVDPEVGAKGRIHLA